MEESSNLSKSVAAEHSVKSTKVSHNLCDLKLTLFVVDIGSNVKTGDDVAIKLVSNI